MNEEYEKKLESVIKQIFEELKGKEIYLAGSAALYLQGIRYEKLSHDVDFCLLSDTETSKNYARYFSHCLKSTKLFVDVLVRSHEFHQSRNIEILKIDFRSLSNIPIASVKDCLNCKYEFMTSDVLNIEKRRKHFSQFKYLLETDQLPSDIKDKFLKDFKSLEQTLL